MWAELEELNLGRLRIASKGVDREGDELVEVDADGQRREGMFMIGQVAALRDRVRHRRRAAPRGERGQHRAPPRPDPARVPADHRRAGAARRRGRRHGRALRRAADLTRFWANVVAGVDAVTEVPAERWAVDRYYTERPR